MTSKEMIIWMWSFIHSFTCRHFVPSCFNRKQSKLVKQFASLAKKLWNPWLFKSQVSPHEFLQEVGRASGSKFRLETQGDPVEFLRWLLNELHKDMGGTKKKNSSLSLFVTLVIHSSLDEKQASYSPLFRDKSVWRLNKWWYTLMDQKMRSQYLT